MRDSLVKRLDLRMNRFVSINFTRTILAYPGLQVVDVRDNAAFDCHISRGLKIFIRRNCKSRYVICLPSLASSIISAKTQFLLPPTSMRTTHEMSYSSILSTTLSLVPPTSTPTTHVMSLVISATLSLLPPTPPRLTHRMSLRWISIQ